MSHTPGPWVIETDEDAPGEVYISARAANPEWWQFARVWVAVEGEPEPDGEANARLIAAAPEMYEAPKIAVEYIGKIDGTMAFTRPDERLTATDLATCRAALAKAEGRS